MQRRHGTPSPGCGWPALCASSLELTCTPTPELSALCRATSWGPLQPVTASCKTKHSMALVAEQRVLQLQAGPGLSPHGALRAERGGVPAAALVGLWAALTALSRGKACLWPEPARFSRSPGLGGCSLRSSRELPSTPHSLEPGLLVSPWPGRAVLRGRAGAAWAGQGRGWGGRAAAAWSACGFPAAGFGGSREGWVMKRQVRPCHRHCHQWQRPREPGHYWTAPRPGLGVCPSSHRVQVTRPWQMIKGRA